MPQQRPRPPDQPETPPEVFERIRDRLQWARVEFDNAENHARLAIREHEADSKGDPCTALQEHHREILEAIGEARFLTRQAEDAITYYERMQQAEIERVAA